jgi:hypothetical protein
MDNFTRILNSGKIVSLQDHIFLISIFNNLEYWIQVSEQPIFEKIENLIELASYIGAEEFWVLIKNKIEILAKSTEKSQVILLFSKVSNFDISMVLFKSHDFTTFKELLFICDNADCTNFSEHVRCEIPKILVSMKTSELIAIARNCNNSDLLLLILDTGKISSINNLIEFGGFEGCYWRVWNKLCELLAPLLKNKSEKYLIQLCNKLQWRWKNSF